MPPPFQPLAIFSELLRMWCDKCQADVAAQASLDNQRLHCTACGTELSVNHAPAIKSGARNPRELLARWAREDAQDRFGPLISTSRAGSAFPSAQSTAAASTPPSSNTPPGAHPGSRRIDAAHATATPQAIAGPASGHAPSEFSGRQVVAYSLLQPAAPSMADRTNQWMALVGQIVAYVGAAVLATGGMLVLTGYFGGPAHYAPLGWLVTTAGQMLLFLGVITLVSAGMEQLSHEVGRRIEGLSNRFNNIETTCRETASAVSSLLPTEATGVEARQPVD